MRTQYVLASPLSCAHRMAGNLDLPAALALIIICGLTRGWVPAGCRVPGVQGGWAVGGWAGPITKEPTRRGREEQGPREREGVREGEEEVRWGWGGWSARSLGRSELSEV